MAEPFNPQRVLLKLLEPGLPTARQVDCLRQLDLVQLDALVGEAKRQGVAPLLYPILAEHKGSDNLDIPQKEQLYQIHLATAVRNTLILHNTKLLLLSLQEAGVSVAGLKGIFLLENVFGNIGSRSMNDIDILIRKKDLSICIKVLERLGYTPTAYFSLDDHNIDTKHVPPMQKKGGVLLEVHWTLLEEDEPFTIDVEAMWERTVPATISDVDVLSLGVEDLILHLCLHLAYQHYLQLGLRGLVDIALVIHKFRSEIDWNRLVEIAKSWGAERVTALTLKLLETQLNVSIPSEVASALLTEGIEPSLLEQARSQLLDRVRFEDHLTPDLVRMNADKNVFSKVRIGLQRVFIPRLTLARIYNVSPNSPKIVGAYWGRLKYLVRNYGGTLSRLRNKYKTTRPALQNAESSYALHDWMTPQKK